MALVESILGMTFYLSVPLVLGGYWLTMTDARVGAGFAGFVVGLAFGLPAGNAVGLVAAAAGAAAGGLVAHQDARLGWGVAGGASGVLLGPTVAGSAFAPLAVVAAVAFGVALGALAWKFPRRTLPLSTGVLGGLLVLVVVSAGSGESLAEAGGSAVAAAVVLGAFVAGMFQPWSAEIGDGVPPLLPLTVRNWFDLVPEGGVGDAVCPTCGGAVDPNAPYCGECDASLAGMVGPADGAAGGSGGTAPDGTTGDAGTTGHTGGTVTDVPADAAAVDVPCPECGERPIEERAKGYGVLGMLILYRWSGRTVVGCHDCNRRRLWTLAGKNFLLGWWSVTALVNPFVILWNVGRGAVNRGPTPKLARHLAESGIDFEYLDDPADFDPDGRAEDELLLRGLLRLGVAVMLADGDADPTEAAAVRDNALELFPAQDAARLEERIQEYAKGTTNAAKVAGGLEETLTRNGRQLALRFAAEVAVADGAVDDAEAQLLSALADELGLSSDAVEAAIGEGVSTADARTSAV